MKILSRSMLISLLICASPLVIADSAKDCLLEGTVQHGEQAGQDTTTVKIHSISQYDEQSRCSVRRDQKMEFKLPPDPRVKDAPDGSDVKYRYRTDDSGQSDTQLISVGA
jgi:hypothetical protein